MKNHRIVVLAGIAVLLGGALALAQTRPDAPKATLGDPARIFDMLAKGRGFFLVEDTRSLRETLTEWLKKRGTKDGKVTRELFLAFYDEARANPAAFATTQPAFAAAQPDRGSKQPPPGGFFQLGTAWEYKTVSYSAQGPIPVDGLNQLGADGWELVAINTPLKSMETQYIFKRSKGRRVLERKEKTDAPRRGEPEPKKQPGGPSGSGGKKGGGFGTKGTFSGSGFGTTTTTVSGGLAQPRAPAKRVFEIVRLKNANAMDLSQVLRPFLTPDVVVGPDPRTNSLILSGTANALEELQRLLVILDEPVRKK